MTIQRLPGSAITPGTITVTQLDSATATVIQTGGGPKITNIQVTDAAYTVLDDTAVDTAGGNIRITGTGFVTGCSVIVGSQPASSVAFISSTEVRVQVGAQSAGTYIVYLVNPDGGVGIRVNGLTYSANPAWQTASALPDQYDGVAISLSLVATEATSYTITSGSLPPGLSLNANTGVITGTVTGVAVDTVYTFTVRATDAELQDSPRTFTVTITVSDPYFKLTTLLLSGSAVSANTVIKDSSTNNFNLTVYGDARASNFTPYGTGWSTYFSSTSGITVSGLTPIGSGDLTIETFVYMTTLSGEQHMVQQGTSTTNLLLSYDGTAQRLRFLVRNDAGSSNLDINSPNAPVINQWFHFAGTVQGTTGRMWIDGNVVTTGTVSGTRSGSQTFVYMGDNGSGGSRPLTGYLSNTRIVVGTAVYTANFSPATTNLSSVSGTSLLTNQSNRFINLVGNVAATISQGSPRITSFNPFNITNTGVNGSAYFDGTGDYVQAANSANLDVGTGDFSIEAWCYKTNTSTATDWRVMGGSASSSGFFGDGGTTSSRGFGIGRSGVAWDVTSNVQAPIYEWFHICYTRKSGAVRIFLNGKLIAYAAGNTNNYGLNAGTLQIVAEQGGNLLTGYLTDFRLFKTVPASYDTAITTINNQVFTPPAQPLTAIANTQLLTLQYDQPHNNHTFLDSSSNQFLLTRYGNATQGTFSPFSQSGWSMFVGGAGYQRWDTNTNYSGTDLTIECWAYAVATTSTFTSLVSSNLGTGNYYQYFNLAIDGSNRLICNFYGTGNVTCNNAALFPLNTWVHCAVVLTSAGAVSLYQDGVRVATTTAASIASIATGIQIGGIVQTSGGGYTAYFNGYISNARIVKSAVYSGTTITVPIAPLSVIANTNLLVCGENRAVDKANGYALGVNTVSRTTVAFSPFASTATYNPAIHGGSVYLDGTGDKLSIPDNDAAFNFGSGDFTVEAWVYPMSSGVTSGRPFYNQSTSGGSTDSAIYVECVSDGVTIYVSVGTGWTYNATSGTLSLGYQWNHVAGVRSGTSLSIYVNGTRAATTTLPANWTMGNSTRIIEIGSQADAAYLNGYISGLRVIRNQALYSGTTYTIPTGPLTTTANTTCLLNFTDAAILDSTGRNALETLGDAKSSSVITKFTGSSLYFDGTGDYLQSSAALSELVFLHNGTPWTVEGWFYTGSTSAQYILSTDAASASIGMCIGLSDTNTRDIMAQIFRGVSGSWVLAISPTNSWSLNTWTHFAATFDSSKNLTVYVNGVQVATASGSSFAFSSANPSYPLVVGRYQSPTPGGYFNGYISDLRVTRGYARYTGNFTAPTVPVRLK